MVQKSFQIACCAAIALILGGCTATRGHGSKDVDTAGIEVAAAARRVVEMYDERRKANEAITPDFMERYCLASERAADAESAAAHDDPKVTTRAFTEHLSRIESFAPTIKPIIREHPYDTSIVDYYAARARLRLAQTKG